MSIRSEFDVHILNKDGITAARSIAEIFSGALSDLEILCGADGREMAIARTKMQEAAFFAKRAMALRAEYQRDESAEAPFVAHEVDSDNIGTADHWRERARVAEQRLRDQGTPSTTIGPNPVIESAHPWGGMWK